MRSFVFDAISDSEEETVLFGERLGAALRSGAVVGLVGPLGAGKTRLAQGIARGSGYRGRVRSPTFALMHLYRGPIAVRHFDFYRLEAIDTATAGEWEEEMEREGLSLIEWADRLPELLPADALWVELAVLSPVRRRIRVRFDLPTSCLGDWRLS